MGVIALVTVWILAHMVYLVVILYKQSTRGEWIDEP